MRFKRSFFVCLFDWENIARAHLSRVSRKLLGEIRLTDCEWVRSLGTLRALMADDTRFGCSHYDTSRALIALIATPITDQA